MRASVKANSNFRKIEDNILLVSATLICVQSMPERTSNVTFTTMLEKLLLPQCKNSWNSCQDLAYSYIFPFTLETLDKILFILASHKPLEFLDSTLGKSLIKSVKRMNKQFRFVYKYFPVVRSTSYTTCIIL